MAYASNMYNMQCSLIEAVILIGYRKKLNMGEIADQVCIEKKQLFRILEGRKTMHHTQEKKLKQWIEANIEGQEG